jgi:hypothetical protein
MMNSCLFVCFFSFVNNLFYIYITLCCSGKFPIYYYCWMLSRGNDNNLVCCCCTYYERTFWLLPDCRRRWLTWIQFHRRHLQIGCRRDRSWSSGRGKCNDWRLWATTSCPLTWTWDSPSCRQSFLAGRCAMWALYGNTVRHRIDFPVVVVVVIEK